MENAFVTLVANLQLARNFGVRCADGLIRSQGYDGETEPERLTGLKAWARAERQYLDWIYEAYKSESLP